MKTPEEIGRAVLERLAAQAAANRAAGDLLRAEVSAVLAQQQPGQRLTAKLVLRRLPTRSAASVRRVQEVMRELRAQSSASRARVNNTETHGV